MRNRLPEGDRSKVRTAVFVEHQNIRHMADHPACAGRGRIVVSSSKKSGSADERRALIGNGDMHLKNWSLVYPDRKNAALAPAYDFVSTIPYIPINSAALNVSRSKSFADFSADELSYFAAKAALPERLVLDTARETVARFREVWAKEKGNLPMSRDVSIAIDAHLPRIPIANEWLSARMSNINMTINIDKTLGGATRQDAATMTLRDSRKMLQLRRPLRSTTAFVLTSQRENLPTVRH